MYTRWFSLSRRFRRAFLHAGICLVWVAGLTLGFAADRFYGDVYCGILERAATCQPSFLGLASINVFPLLISAFAVWINPFLLYVLCLFRGMSLGVGLCSCVGIYGQAGLMMSGLLLFSLMVFSPVLLWYWSGTLRRDKSVFRRDTAVCVCIALILAAADYWMIAPFLQEVIMF